MGRRQHQQAVERGLGLSLSYHTRGQGGWRIAPRLSTGSMCIRPFDCSEAMPGWPVGWGWWFPGRWCTRMRR